MGHCRSRMTPVPFDLPLGRLCYHQDTHIMHYFNLLCHRDDFLGFLYPEHLVCDFANYKRDDGYNGAYCQHFPEMFIKPAPTIEKQVKRQYYGNRNRDNRYKCYHASAQYKKRQYQQNTGCHICCAGADCRF